MGKYTLRVLFIISSLLAFSRAEASHIVGGEMTYTYNGDTTMSSTVYHKYTVSLSIYEDCLNGQPEAITQDNPAFLGAFDAVTGTTIILDTNVNFASSVTVPVLYGSACSSVSSDIATCLLKKTFIKTFYLQPNSGGYVVAYERCCRNAAIVNVIDPGDNGSTYYCNIPAYPVVNNCAKFKNYPPQIICLNQPLFYDHSATDADGDSLSYSFCAPLNGANDANIKPTPYYPHWNDSVSYVAPTYSSQWPVTGTPAMAIDPVTGMITGTPDKTGRYLVDVRCSEWRDGVLVNTVTREFQFVVAVCSGSDYHPYAGGDTIIMVGDSAQFHASGGISYSWSPATYLNNPNISDPVGVFPIAGDFSYTLHEVSDSGCSGTDVFTVHVLDHSIFIVPKAFTPNGDSKNDLLRPIPIFGGTLLNFKVFNRKGNLVYNGWPGDPGWDGTFNGVKQDMDTYYWELFYKDNKGAERKMKGDVTLVR